MNKISFFVAGSPLGQKRVVPKKRGNFVVPFDPSAKDKVNFLASIQHHRPEFPITGPIVLGIQFIMPRPNMHLRTKGGMMINILKENAPYVHSKKPDLDNLIKFVKDALNGVFWRDDAQIYRYTDPWKRYHREGEAPGTRIDICWDESPILHLLNDTMI